MSKKVINKNLINDLISLIVYQETIVINYIKKE